MKKKGSPSSHEKSEKKRKSSGGGIPKKGGNVLGRVGTTGVFCAFPSSIQGEKGERRGSPEGRVQKDFITEEKSLF